MAVDPFAIVFAKVFVQVGIPALTFIQPKSEVR